MALNLATCRLLTCAAPRIVRWRRAERCTVTSRRSPMEKIDRFTLSSAPVASAMRSTYEGGADQRRQAVVRVERSRDREYSRTRARTDRTLSLTCVHRASAPCAARATRARVVRDEHPRLPARVQLRDEREQRLAVRGVEISGRLVGEKQAADR